MLSTSQIGSTVKKNQKILKMHPIPKVENSSTETTLVLAALNGELVSSGDNGGGVDTKCVHSL